MPNEPSETNFKSKIHLTAYPTVEMGGVIWAYLGVKEKKPPEPRFEWTQVPGSHRTVSKTWQECNWLQALEGSIDTAHFAFLHRSIGDGQRRTLTRKMQVRTIPPKEEVDTTDYGFVYASVRSLGEEGSYVRMLHYVMPFHEYFPNQLGDEFEHKKPIVRGHMFVPMNDENCMVYNWAYTFGNEPLEEAMDLEVRAGRSHDDQTADFRKVRNKDNNWLINRDIQKTRTYTGIEGVNTQDHAVQESMGPIVDRTQEHLGSTDRAIIIARRLLLQAITSVQKGEDPQGVGTSYYKIRAIEALLPRGVGWRDAFKEMFESKQQDGKAGSAAEV
jgi:phenylpropionate dioxygenase-like ring-hydroxylating dioxygenase large terminal subunit